jgi:hypothetical protein
MTLPMISDSVIEVSTKSELDTSDAPQGTTKKTYIWCRSWRNRVIIYTIGVAVLTLLGAAVYFIVKAFMPPSPRTFRKDPPIRGVNLGGWLLVGEWLGVPSNCHRPCHPNDCQR